jgi:hypothetical protein
MSKTIKVNQDQKAMLTDFIAKVTLTNRTVNVTNDLEHKAAKQLVDAGLAKIVYFKNYGHIAAIKGVNS